MRVHLEKSVDSGKERLHCPFCGQDESERVVVEGKLLIIFPCMFSPLVDDRVGGMPLQKHLDTVYGSDPNYFRQQCDRLHLAVVKGAA